MPDPIGSPAARNVRRRGFEGRVFTRRLLLAFSAAALVAPPLAASVPPVGWKGPRWNGPGLLCRPSFTLALQEGEQAEEQYPSVGMIRYVVRSDKGVFEVAEDWYVRTYPDRELLREGQNGTVYRLAGNPGERSYWFVPKDRALPFLLRFDPLMNQPPSFTGEAEQEVLERLSFAKGEPQGCLEEEKPAGRNG